MPGQTGPPVQAQPVSDQTGPARSQLWSSPSRCVVTSRIPAPASTRLQPAGQQRPAQPASHGHISQRPVPVLRGCARHEGWGGGMRPEGQGEARAEVKGNKGVDEGAGGPSGPGLAGLGRRFLAGLQDLRLVRLVFADGSQLSGSRSLLDSVLCSDARHRKCGGAGRSVQNEIAGSTKPARASWIQIGPREPRAVSRRERPSSRPRPAPTNPATELP